MVSFGLPTGAWGVVLVAYISLLLQLALFVTQIYAFVDCAIRKSAAFPAADKLTKPGWLLINGLAIVVSYFFPPWFGLLGIAGAIATMVYLTDVRPAVRSMTGG